MSPMPNTVHSESTSVSVYEALARLHCAQPQSQVVIQLLERLLMEVEALREALSDPSVPDTVRAAYKQAYARTAIMSHHSAGPHGGLEKLLRRYCPRAETGERFWAERQMMARLGATADEQTALCEGIEEVESYT